MYERAVEIAKVLENRAIDLDIPESKYLEAKKRYEAVGDWLHRDDSPLFDYSPEIYPQGSFRLGTVVKPFGKNEYDIDLVCYLNNATKQTIAQGELKKIVGERLKNHETYKKILDKEGRRCWTLLYADEFHMDILPAIKDEEMRNLGTQYKDAILITDTKKIKQSDTEWPKSNPIGYADWFFSRQEKVFSSAKKKYAEKEQANIEEIEDYKIKTPLQRTVQILKRHRDIYFSPPNDKNKPISIIITTLAGHFYNNQQDVFNAIYDILQKINHDLLIKDGKYHIPNPANKLENFADKWNEDSELPKAFFNWLKRAKDLFFEQVFIKESEEIKKDINESLGFPAAQVSSHDIDSSTIYVQTSERQSNKPWKEKLI